MCDISSCPNRTLAYSKLWATCRRPIDAYSLRSNLFPQLTLGPTRTNGGCKPRTHMDPSDFAKPRRVIFSLNCKPEDCLLTLVDASPLIHQCPSGITPTFHPEL